MKILLIGKCQLVFIFKKEKEKNNCRIVSILSNYEAHFLDTFFFFQLNGSYCIFLFSDKHTTIQIKFQLWKNSTMISPNIYFLAEVYSEVYKEGFQNPSWKWGMLLPWLSSGKLGLAFSHSEAIDRLAYSGILQSN